MSEIRFMTEEEIAERNAGYIYLDSSDVMRINELLQELELADISIKEFVNSLKEADNE